MRWACLLLAFSRCHIHSAAFIYTNAFEQQLLSLVCSWCHNIHVADFTQLYYYCYSTTCTPQHSCHWRIGMHVALMLQHSQHSTYAAAFTQQYSSSALAMQHCCCCSASLMNSFFAAPHRLTRLCISFAELTLQLSRGGICLCIYAACH